MKKKYIVIIIVLLLIALYFIFKDSIFKKDDTVAVTTELVQLRDIVETVTASGKIYAEEEVKISSDVSGEIVELNIKDGQYVQKGDLLAKIQPETYQAVADQANAQYSNAVANLKNSQANYSNTLAKSKQVQAQFDNANQAYQRAKALYEKKTISTQDLEQAEMNFRTAKAEVEAIDETIKGAKFSIEAAQASVEGAQASIRDAKSNLTKTSIYAPMSGIISLLNVEKGEKVVGTLQMAGTEMMRISNFANMEVRVDVSENEITKVKIGDTANVEVDAYIDRKFVGIVTQVSNTSKGLSGDAVSTEESSNFIVRVRILESSYEDLIQNGNHAFLPGMSATVDVFTKKVEKTVAIPVQAVTIREDSISHMMQEVVFVVNENNVKQIPVKTGIQDDTYIQILEGLKDKDIVAVGPYNIISKTLKDGDKVKELKE
ncbi:MAG: efflux RND transporter periplasmic adaptor subunit [Chitinophagales bacterium]|nr:efflux RND transporter periplasmic adaptor subunit [Chitinophagales bacterium]